ncbi:SRPBCC family protein [Methylobacterium sp. C25]|uniref:Carbon monoxide dehydrogenase subunit G n=1 Tax=Methylobacterium brachythecii TaxID=1176177 RepID=A0A7W6F6S2_9HYPH|nr:MULTISPECIES: SRPBCC family protein [Methylobacterium]MBB3902613.1 carbon monoxide dehydrogenase subunit G [Methylobacterium brachythecii]MCE4223561.1 SRPBCC family protein [Methylobacterium sp. C25]GLS42457.1 MxaD family protein [Methylobacterium brachythecii]
MRYYTTAAVAVLAAVSFAAQAHGPSRQKVSEEVEINAPADKVWAVVGNFQDGSWIPVVEKTEGKGGNEVKATRTLHLKGGATVDEELAKYDAGKKTFMYRINKVDVKVLPVNDYSSTIEVEDAGGKTKVTWKGAFYRGYMNNDPPPELNDEASKKAVSGLYRASLDNLKAKVEKGS